MSSHIFLEYRNEKVLLAFKFLYGWRSSRKARSFNFFIFVNFSTIKYFPKVFIMSTLITASRCIKLLKENGVADFKLPYFSKRDAEGIFTHHHKSPSPKKFFIYEEVVEALKNNKDPRRDAQRAAHEKKREENDIFSMAGTYSSVVDRTPEEQNAEQKRLRIIFEKKQAEAVEMGLDTETNDEDVAKLSVAALNRKILEQNLRIQTSKADDLDEISIPKEKVIESIFASSRVIRDGMMGIAPRLSSRIAAISDPHECRVMIEEEVVRQLSKLEDILREL